MDYSEFQVEVIRLASAGEKLTAANVVAELRVDPERVERWLDRMAREGRLDLEVDEDEGVVVYRVRGLSTRARPRARLDGLAAAGHLLDPRVARIAKSFMKSDRPLPLAARRDVRVAALLGALFPGAGLAYAAPWSVALIGTVAVWVGFKILAMVSFFFLGVPFLVAAAACSALLGGLYAHRYNQTGRRARLLEDESPSRLSP